MAMHYCAPLEDPDVALRNPFIGWTARDIIDMTQNGLAPYDFLQRRLQSPLHLKPSEIYAMLKTCLVQRAAVHFIRDSPKADAYDNTQQCSSRELAKWIVDPLERASMFVETFDFDVVLDDDELRASRCVQQVASSLAKDLLEKMAMPKVPAGPSSAAWLMGTRQHTSHVDLHKFKNHGLEWVDAWLSLKRWHEDNAELQGWMIEPASSEDDPLSATITLYYLK